MQRMAALANGHQGGLSDPPEKHHHKHNWSRQMRNSFNVVNNSFKIAAEEVQLLERQTLAFFEEIPDAIWWLVKRVLCPLLLLYDLVGFVQNLFVTGWQAALSNVIFHVLSFVEVPLAIFGRWLECQGNKLLGGYKPIVRPGFSDEDKANVEDSEPELFIPELPLSAVGLLDKCMALQSDTVKYFPSPSSSSRPNAEVCAMASKLAYESERVARNVINHLWNTKWVEDGKEKDIDSELLEESEKFEFLRWFTFERRAVESKKAKNGDGTASERKTEDGKKSKYGETVETQAMMFKKGNAIIVAFRGTEPFNSIDWRTDFYLPWWEFPALGRVHQGFLQGLGLGFLDEPKGQELPHPAYGPLVGSSKNPNVIKAKQDEKKRLNDFSEYIALCMTRFRAVAERSTLVGEPSKRKQELFDQIETDRKNKLHHFLADYVLVKGSDKVRDDAPLYWQIRGALLAQLETQPDAQIFITGHSLGGALSALFTGLLAAENDEVTQRIAALHTFGQPRVGDWTFAWFLHNRMNVPEHRYVRMIYGYDLVPRVPFDADPFEFKHLGPFHWVNAHYHIKIGTFDEQPGLNFVRAFLTAWFELFYNTAWCAVANTFFRPAPYHRPLESWPQVLARVGSIMFPYLGAHSPINYVNAVRHGMPEGKTKKPLVNEAH